MTCLVCLVAKHVLRWGKWCPCRALEIVRGSGLHGITVSEAGTRFDATCQGTCPTTL